jgi:hypothetical protein
MSKVDAYVQAIAPFVLALYLLFENPFPTKGKSWYTDRLKKNLTNLGVKEPEKQLNDFWIDTQAASQPANFAATCLASFLGIYLLLPIDSKNGWLYGVGLFFVGILLVAVARRLPPQRKLNKDRSDLTISISQWLSAFVVGGGLVASVLKVALS